jgi:hypothetical protein
MRNKIEIVTWKLNERFGEFSEKDFVEDHQIKTAFDDIKERARISTKSAGVPDAASYLKNIYI